MGQSAVDTDVGGHSLAECSGWMWELKGWGTCDVLHVQANRNFGERSLTPSFLRCSSVTPLELEALSNLTIISQTNQVTRQQQSGLLRFSFFYSLQADSRSSLRSGLPPIFLNTGVLITRLLCKTRTNHPANLELQLPDLADILTFRIEPRRHCPRQCIACCPALSIMSKWQALDGWWGRV